MWARLGCLVKPASLSSHSALSSFSSQFRLAIQLAERKKLVIRSFSSYSDEDALLGEEDLLDQDEKEEDTGTEINALKRKLFKTLTLRARLAKNNATLYGRDEDQGDAEVPFPDDSMFSHTKKEMTEAEILRMANAPSEEPLSAAEFVGMPPAEVFLNKEKELTDFAKSPAEFAILQTFMKQKKTKPLPLLEETLEELTRESPFPDQFQFENRETEKRKLHALSRARKKNLKEGEEEDTSSSEVEGSDSQSEGTESTTEKKSNKKSDSEASEESSSSSSSSSEEETHDHSKSLEALKDLRESLKKRPDFDMLNQSIFENSISPEEGFHELASDPERLSESSSEESSRSDTSSSLSSSSDDEKITNADAAALGTSMLNLDIKNFYKKIGREDLFLTPMEAQREEEEDEETMEGIYPEVIENPSLADQVLPLYPPLNKHEGSYQGLKQLLHSEIKKQTELFNPKISDEMEYDLNPLSRETTFTNKNFFYVFENGNWQPRHHPLNLHGSERFSSNPLSFIKPTQDVPKDAHLTTIIGSVLEEESIPFRLKEVPTVHTTEVRSSSAIQSMVKWSSLAIPKARISKSSINGSFQGHGIRKSARAIVSLTPSNSGLFSVNGKPACDYFDALPEARAQILVPFAISNLLMEFQVSAKVQGGGKTAQAEAIKFAMVDGLINYCPSLRLLFKNAHLTGTDARKVERKKPGKKKARKSFQWVKR